jgi:asparagine synthase (glutamine-hydrolysing)
MSNGARVPLEGSYSDHCDQVERCLGEAVGSQMLSDVPLGCFLSGGVDSSLVTALMRQNSDQVRSFSIGFEAKRFNEARHAREVATHLGTRHTEFVVTEADALAVVPELPRIYDEPFADSSQIPATLLARLARQDVTVALTGNGADEIFGGYNRHVLLPKVWRALRPLPLSGRRGLGHVFAIMQRAVAGEQNALHQVTRRLGLPLTTLDKLGQVGSAIAGARDSSDFYRAMVSMVPDSARLVLRPGAAATLPAMEGVDLAQWTMAMDTLDFLPGDVLVKVDRAAMSASLETRAPFLDRRVVELAWRLPLGAKIKGRTGKRILRDILVRHVPRALTDRPKQGFAIPIDQWLRGALRDWAEHQLAPAQLVAGGIVDVGKVRRLWEDHLGNRANAGPQLWNVLMFQSWLDHQAAQREPSVQAARRA